MFRLHRRKLPYAIATALIGTALLASSSHAVTGTPPTFTAPSRADNPANGNGPTEPATVIDRNGIRYVANQGGSQLSWTNDGGRSWSHLPRNVLTRKVTGCTAGTDDVGDVELTTDQAGRTYFADLQATAGGSPDTGVQPVVATSDDGFLSYNGTCAAHQPFSVDREWMAAWTPPGHGADDSRVYLTYHDFGPDAMWVNTSTDGGRTWGNPVNILASVDALASSFCDTVPGGIAVDNNTGWVYAAWSAGDTPATNAGSGCNYTQATVFNKLYVSVSKDEGKTWTTSLAFASPGYSADEPSDMSEIFTSIAVATDGTVYVSFPAFLDHEYGIYMASSPPASPQGTLLAPGNALNFSTPVKVSPTDVHTAYFTRMVAGDKGRVDLIYLGSPVKNFVATPSNKATYTGKDPTLPNCSPELGSNVQGVRDIGKPCQMPAAAPWYLYLAQTIDGKTFTNQKLRTDAVHKGDICTLGIFCLPGDDRDLADTNDIKIDRTGGFQVAYTAESYNPTRNEIDFQCQLGGTGLYANVTVKPCQ